MTGSLFAVHVVSIIIAGRLPIATNRKELLILAGVASGTLCTSSLLSVSCTTIVGSGPTEQRTRYIVEGGRLAAVGSCEFDSRRMKAPECTVPVLIGSG